MSSKYKLSELEQKKNKQFLYSDSVQLCVERIYVYSLSLCITSKLQVWKIDGGKEGKEKGRGSKMEIGGWYADRCCFHFPNK